MSTRMVFDVQRPTIKQFPFHVYRPSKMMNDPTDGKGYLTQWSGTGSWTLRPINWSVEFKQNNYWDALKYRLYGCTYDSNWFAEHAAKTINGTSFDYFIESQIRNNSISSSGIPLAGMNDYFSFPALPNLLQNTSESVSAVCSQSIQPKNQGYHLRFYIEGYETDSVGSYMQFLFGQFILCINTDGTATLWQSSNLTGDGGDYVYVAQFVWAEKSQIHKAYHTVTIFPHAKNAIEFSFYSGNIFDGYKGGKQTFLTAPRTSFYYRLPGKVKYDTEGDPIVTQANYWAMRLSKFYNHYFQVSNLAFVNASADVNEYLWDVPIPAHQYVENQIATGFDAVTPGNTAIWASLIDPDNNNLPWAPPANRMQFGFKMVGNADIGPNPDGIYASSITPEFFGYSLYAAETYQSYSTTPRDFPVISVSCDSGDTPENESAHVVLDNTDGALDAYTARAQMDVAIVDTEQDITLFEGVAFGQTTAEGLGNNQFCAMTCPIKGMSDRLSRAKWPGHNPDFGKDPNDPSQGWLMPAIIKTAFAYAGFSPDQVNIEEEAQYLANFRAWSGIFGGGPQGLHSDGDGHEVQGLHNQWQPSGQSSINEYIDWLLRDILGWHFCWDKKYHRWNIYRRPNPTNQSDVNAGKFVPKAAFYKTPQLAAQAPLGIPSYTLSHYLMGPIERALYTTLIVTAYRAGVPDDNALQEILSESQPGLNTGTYRLKDNDKVAVSVFDNPWGYQNAHNPTPNLNHPDWLGQRKVQTLPLTVIGLNNDAMKWVGRRYFEDNCRGQVPITFEADWGDPYTYNLRKYDVVAVESRRFGGSNGMCLCYIDRIEPSWDVTNSGADTPNSGGATVTLARTNAVKTRRAKYRVWVYRDDGPAPR